VLRACERVVIERSGERPVERPRDLPHVSVSEIKERFQEKAVIVLDGYVVDVAGFAKEHPGGEGLLRAGYGGRDLSHEFRTLNHHTRHARGLVEDMRIARLVGE
jgi:stearoyl-CoA desaturase (delta-9 desaturase)